MTTSAEVVTHIDSVLDGPLSLVVDAAPDSEWDARRLRLSKEAADAFRSMAHEVRDRIDAGDARAYGANAELSRDEFFLVDDASTVAELAVFREVVLRATSLDPVAPSELSEKIPLYAVGIGADEHRVALVKRTDPQLTHRTGRLLAIGRQRLERIDDPVFSFASDFDLVVAAGWVVVLNQHAFEMLARETGIVERNVARWITGITNHLPMAEESVKLLRRTALRDSRTWRRLKEIEQRGHLAMVSLEDVRDYAAAVDLEPDDVVRDGQLRFDPSQRFGFLHLLNEDLFTGRLTGERFESQRKDAMA